MPVAEVALGAYPIAVDAIRYIRGTTVTFVKARSRVEQKFNELKEKKYGADRWVQNADDLIEASPPSQAARLQNFRRQLDECLCEYQTAVVEWCSFVQPNCLGEALSMSQDAKSEGQVSDQIHVQTSKRKLALKGRAKFALSGQKRLEKLAAHVLDREKQLMLECTAAQTGVIVNTRPPRKIESSPNSVSNSVLLFIHEARLREHHQCPVDEIVWNLDFPYEFVNERFIDDRTANMYIEEYKITLGTLRPTATSELSRVPFSEYSNCIIIRRSAGSAPEAALEDTYKIARLFKEDRSDSQSDGFNSEPEDGHMLRCCKIVRYNLSRCDMLFRTPPGCKPMPRTLRQMLIDESSSNGPLHPLLDRIKFSIRLATAVLVVHSLGLVHKRIHPETILVFESLQMNKRNAFPYRLGYPYLAAFQYTRSDLGGTFGFAECEALRKRSVYTHTRDQGEEREDRIRQRDDIFSMGVVLFEVGTFKPLFKDYDPIVRDYVHDDSFVPLSDANFPEFADPKDRAEAKIQVLLEATKEKIIPILGKDFADVIQACICAGYPDSPFNDDPSLKEHNETQRIGGDHAYDPGRKPDSVKYLELVLKKLHAIHDKFERQGKKGSD